MSEAIPSAMKRLVVTKGGTSIQDCTVVVESVPTPKPASGEVLIKVVAAPVNPSDYGSWMHPRSSDAYPMPMGKEGCGIVVATSGFLAGFRFPVGTKVGFILVDTTQQGSYSEYVTVSATKAVFAMPQDKPIEDCASFFVNPYTACAILDTVRNEVGSNVLVHTAAASQLGQMLHKLALSEGMEIIHIVRREEQADFLKSLGAKHVITTATSNWKEELKSKIQELGATCAFDAVGGDMTGTLVELLPDGGTCFVYGGLSRKRVGNVSVLDLVYRRITVKGFLLTHWIPSGGFLQMIGRLHRSGAKVNAGLHDGGWSSSTFRDTTLEKAFQDVVSMVGTSVKGKKLRIRFDKG